MKKYFLALVFLFTPVLGSAANIDLQSSPMGLWSISNSSTHSRWIEIHYLNEAKSSGIYHINIIARKHGAPVWKIEHVKKHMAITAEALEKSVIAPRKNGSVYPESFNDGYQQWKAENNGKGGAVCSTSINECLQP